MFKLCHLNHTNQEHANKNKTGWQKSSPVERVVSRGAWVGLQLCGVSLKFVDHFYKMLWYTPAVHFCFLFVILSLYTDLLVSEEKKALDIYDRKFYRTFLLYLRKQNWREVSFLHKWIFPDSLLNWYYRILCTPMKLCVEFHQSVVGWIWILGHLVRPSSPCFSGEIKGSGLTVKTKETGLLFGWFLLLFLFAYLSKWQAHSRMEMDWWVQGRVYVHKVLGAESHAPHLHNTQLSCVALFRFSGFGACSVSCM